MNDIKLNDEQQKVVKTLETSQENIFLTGVAGTGKSTVINYFLQHTKKRLAKLASTGAAADNIEGSTIHNYFKLPYNYLNEEILLFVDENLQNKLKNIDAILIDEISMVNAYTFTIIDKILRKSLNNNNVFGGLQVIVTGDFCQLKIGYRADSIQGQFCEKHGGIYAFNSQAWQEAKFKCLNLETIHRQGDVKFKELLNRVRKGADYLTNHDLEWLNQRHKPFDGRFVDKTILCTLNKTVKYYQKITSIPLSKRKSHEYIAFKTDNFTGKLPMPKKVKLMQFQRVMLTKNIYFDEKLIPNGALGTVVDLSPDSVMVKFDNVFNYVEIYNEVWQNDLMTISEDNRVREQAMVGYFKQIPLTPANVITIHKSQGKTLNKIHIINDKLFTSYQLYTALSRAQRLEDITLEFPVTREQFITNKEVIKFYNKLNQN